MAEDIESVLAAAAEARRQGLALDRQSFPLQIRAVSGLGQIERDRGALDSAQQHCIAALNLSRAQGQTLAVAASARHLGNVYRESGLSELAESLLSEAIALYRSTMDTKSLDLANAIRLLVLLMTSQGIDSAARRRI